MPIQAPQWTDFLTCPVCLYDFDYEGRLPISLGCGHTICLVCIDNLSGKLCPFDQAAIADCIRSLLPNVALLQLLNLDCTKLVDKVPSTVPSEHWEAYRVSMRCIEALAVYLKPLSKANRDTDTTSLLSRPLQRKLVTLINCQLGLEEGKVRAVRAARSIGERTVTELILQHQNGQLSTNLWAAVRARGCQFLGPAMQEETLKLVLLALENGAALSRKVLVLFVVQRLEQQFPQASKTSVGHVVQLLYRASCFKVTKREEESSLMELKEEFRQYDTLRREHDTQIVQIAIEAGLRISPEQWSLLLYGDQSHKSHMQSIIDKLQTPESFGSSIRELTIALQRSSDPAQLSKLRLKLEKLAEIDQSPEIKSYSWEAVQTSLQATQDVVAGLVDFLKNHSLTRRAQEQQTQSIKYKTSMCRDIVQKGGCPRGSSCTFAHSEEELERFRARSRRMLSNMNRQNSRTIDKGLDMMEPRLGGPSPGIKDPHAAPSFGGERLSFDRQQSRDTGYASVPGTVPSRSTVPQVNGERGQSDLDARYAHMTSPRSGSPGPPDPRRHLQPHSPFPRPGVPTSPQPGVISVGVVGSSLPSRPQQVVLVERDPRFVVPQVSQGMWNVRGQSARMGPTSYATVDNSLQTEEVGNKSPLPSKGMDKLRTSEGLQMENQPKDENMSLEQLQLHKSKILGLLDNIQRPESYSAMQSDGQSIVGGVSHLSLDDSPRHSELSTVGSPHLSVSPYGTSPVPSVSPYISSPRHSVSPYLDEESYDAWSSRPHKNSWKASDAKYTTSISKVQRLHLQAQEGDAQDENPTLGKHNMQEFQHMSHRELEKTLEQEKKAASSHYERSSKIQMEIMRRHQDTLGRDGQPQSSPTIRHPGPVARKATTSLRNTGPVRVNAGIASDMAPVTLIQDCHVSPGIQSTPGVYDYFQTGLNWNSPTIKLWDVLPSSNGGMSENERQRAQELLKDELQNVSKKIEQKHTEKSAHDTFLLQREENALGDIWGRGAKHTHGGTISHLKEPNHHVKKEGGQIFSAMQLSDPQQQSPKIARTPWSPYGWNTMHGAGDAQTASSEAEIVPGGTYGREQLEAESRYQSSPFQGYPRDPYKSSNLGW